jgi:SAM-dependent methyltransferase
MHATVLDFVKRTLTAEYVEGISVLEVGSYDVNGSVRPYVMGLKPWRYFGVDAQEGPGVDRVVDCESLTFNMGYAAYGLVISTEMLEHVRDWRTCMMEMASAVKPGGYLLITTRSPGFPYHAFPEDHWRFTKRQMRDIMHALEFEVLALEDDPEPGVFVFAHRLKIGLMPHVYWAGGALELIEPERAIR